MALFNAYYKNAFPVIIVIFVTDSGGHALNYSQYIVSDTNKHLKFDLNRKLKR